MSTYTVVLEREEDGQYSVYVPDLPGCASMGDNKREALANIREAIALVPRSARQPRAPCAAPPRGLRTRSRTRCVTKLPDWTGARLLRALKKAGFVEAIGEGVTSR